MDTKFTTQRWSGATQTSGLKGDSKHYTPATKSEAPEADGKAKGHSHSSGSTKNEKTEKNIGDILNKAADPNYTGSQAKRNPGKTELGKDDFLKLMLTQMKYQDPLNPMDSQQMATQLAQFTSLEQLQNMNASLGDLKKAQEPMQKYEALNLLGKTINSDSTKLNRIKGDTNHDMSFSLAADAQDVKITVKNQMGEPVRTYEIKDLKKGDNKVTWNGMNEQSQEQMPGEYSFEVEAKNSTGKKLQVSTSVSGKITGINYTAQGPVLMVGDKSVRLSEVVRIEDSDLKQAQGKDLRDVTNQALPAAAKKEDTEGNGTKPKVGQQILNQVPMNGKMLNGLKNEVQKESQKEALTELKPAAKGASKSLSKKR